MEKNWLIRTKNNHILGPVSKQKVKELLEKGSIKGDDEITSGNGYWFFIREKELVDKYIMGNTPQGFNPVSEALTVLAMTENSVLDTLVPSEEDLSYPDIEGKMPEDNDLSYPEEPMDEIGEQEDTLEKLREKASKKKVSKAKTSNKKKNHQEKEIKKMKNSHQGSSLQKSALNQNVLYFLAIFFFILALLAFYYRRRIVREFIETRNFVIQPVYAQVIPDAVKKK